MSNSNFFASKAAPSLTFDKDRKDEIGFDPFGLRVPGNARVADDKDTFEEVVKKCNLWGQEIILPERKTLKEHQVPDYVHFIWLGEREIGGAEIGRKNILSWKEKNPEKICVIWINTLDPVTKKPLPEEIIEERKKWCRDNNIVLLDFEQVFAGVIPNEKAFYRELIRKNFGAASDILRCAILKKYKGIYSDIDIACAKPLGELFAPLGIKVNTKQRSATHDFKLLMDTEINSIMNDLILVSENSGEAEVDKLIKAMAKNYQVQADTLLNAGIDIAGGWKKLITPYQEAYNIISSDQIFRELTIVRTGPGVFSDLYGANENAVRARKGEAIMIDPTYFSFQSGRTWLDPESRQATKSEMVSNMNILKRVFSCILADLQLEDGRVLRLDNYAKDLARPTMALTILRMLHENYPELANKIEYVKFGGCIMNDDPSSMEFIDDLFNKKYFPKLTRDGKFYTNNYQFAQELHEKGVDYSNVKLFKTMLNENCSISEYKKIITLYENSKMDCKSLLEDAILFFGYRGYNLNAVAAVLQKGYDNNLQTFFDKNTPSLAHHAASTCKNVETFNALMDYCISKKLPLDEKDKQGKTPLDILNERYEKKNTTSDEVPQIIQLMKQSLEKYINTNKAAPRMK